MKLGFCPPQSPSIPINSHALKLSLSIYKQAADDPRTSRNKHLSCIATPIVRSGN